VLLHLLGELSDSLLGVAVDQGLVDVEFAVEIEKDVHLPFLLFYGDVVLLNTFDELKLIYLALLLRIFTFLLVNNFY
jgi:hypothetical protein